MLKGFWGFGAGVRVRVRVRTKVRVTWAAAPADHSRAAREIGWPGYG